MLWQITLAVVMDIVDIVEEAVPAVLQATTLAVMGANGPVNGAVAQAVEQIVTILVKIDVLENVALDAKDPVLGLVKIIVMGVDLGWRMVVLMINGDL